MTRFRLIASRRALALGVLAASLASAQTSHRAAPAGHTNPSAAARQASDSDSEVLGRLLAAQQGAQSAGDPAAVASTSRQLIAFVSRQLAQVRLVEGKSADAIELYQSALQLEPSTKLQLELASLLLRTGHPAEASTAATAATEAEPRNAEAWVVRGSALRAAGKEAAAAEAFTRALELHQDVNTAYALGSALLAAHQEEKAAQIFHQILTASANDPVWHVAVGDAYREARYYDQAVAEFKAAIARDRRAAHAEFFLGLTYLQMNQWGPNSQSFEHLREAVRLSPHEYVSNFYLGALESTDGSDLASSNRHLEAAAAADPTSPEVWLYLGLNANRQKDAASARRFLQKAIDLTGTDEARNNYQVRRAYFALGRLLISEGDQKGGQALLERYKRAEQASVAESTASISSTMGANDAKADLSSLSSAALPASAKPSAPETVTPGPQLAPAEQKKLREGEAQLGTMLASAYNDLGTAEARQQQYALAVSHFQQAERWDKPSPALLRNLGIAAFRSENFPEASRALGLYLHPAGATEVPRAGEERTQLVYALSLFSLGDFASASRAFAAASELALQDPRAAYSWAFSLAHSGGNTQANQIATTLSTQALPPDVLLLVCHLFVDTENYEASIPCYRKAYAADPALKLAHYQVAESLIRLDRPAEAIPELKQELTLSPDDPNVQYSLAFALLQTSDRTAALALLQRITAAHPEHAQAQYQLGKLMLESGDVAGAIGHLELSERADNSPDYVHYQLGSAYRKASRVADSDRELKMYREIKDRNRDSKAIPQTQ